MPAAPISPRSLRAHESRPESPLQDAWKLRDERITSTLIGASSVSQLEANVATLERSTLSEEELAEIDQYATEGSINLWRPPDLP